MGPRTLASAGVQVEGVVGKMNGSPKLFKNVPVQWRFGKETAWYCGGEEGLGCTGFPEALTGLHRDSAPLVICPPLGIAPL